MRHRFGIGIYIIAFILHLSKHVVPYHIEGKHIVDLLHYVVVSNNTKDNPHSLVSIPAADSHSKAYLFQGSHRQIEVASEAVHSIQNLLSQQKEFTILAAVKQQSNNTGSIISFTLENKRFLELESSGRRNELRFHYYPDLHPPSSPSSHPHTQTFPFHLADGRWHQVALTVSRHFLRLHIDCKKIYERQIAGPDLSTLSQLQKVHLWLGQRGKDAAYFKGAMEYVKLVIYPQGELVQCPQANIACPTCSQFHHLESSVHELYQVVHNLNQKLLAAEEKLLEMDKCECMLSCVVNGTRYRDGESWQKDHCTKCTCRGGEVSCPPPMCHTPSCKHPVMREGECCKTCLRQCYYNAKSYEHLEEFKPLACTKCVCKDGFMTCDHQDQTECPDLPCTSDNQISVEGECCKFCKGTDYCSKGHDCHQQASCYNMDTMYTCHCNDGYHGDGVQDCQDIDECMIEGGRNGHHCHSNTICVNTVGSYQCDCLPGYVRQNDFACRELDECSLELDNCHINALCINLEGSFTCECMSGYQGNGHICEPVCRKGCDNGGTCISPDRCLCRQGFFGAHCQNDLDECDRGLSHCHPNSDCINIPGHYYCQCKKGYHSDHHDNLNGLLCRDVNECEGWGTGHECPPGTQCRNTQGGYTCVCLQQASCHSACQIDGVFHANGTAWNLPGDKCSQCVCEDGEVRCGRRRCECHTGYDDPQCCPQCDLTKTCRHQELPAVTYYSGDTWIYQCQTCECLDGEVDCWALECPVISCSKIVHEKGDCCPRCVDEDPCTASLHQGLNTVPSPMSTVCFFDGRRYLSGDRWVVSWDICSACTCQAGQICCKYNETCEAIRTLLMTTQYASKLRDQELEAANQRYYQDNSPRGAGYQEYGGHVWDRGPGSSKGHRALRQGAANRLTGPGPREPRTDRVPGSVLDPYVDTEEGEEDLDPDQNSGYFANPGSLHTRIVPGLRRTPNPPQRLLREKPRHSAQNSRPRIFGATLAPHNIPGRSNLNSPVNRPISSRQLPAIYEGGSAGPSRSASRQRTLGGRRSLSQFGQGAVSWENTNPHAVSADLSQTELPRGSQRRKNSRKSGRRRSKPRRTRAGTTESPGPGSTPVYSSELEVELTDTVSTDNEWQKSGYRDPHRSPAHQQQPGRRRHNFDRGG